MTSMSYQYFVRVTTVSNIIQETCAVIWDILYPLVLPGRLEEKDWVNITNGFEKWNFFALHWSYRWQACCHPSMYIDYQYKIYIYPANENGLKWTEMDSFHSCQIQILNFWIHFYPIKISEFFKIHFNSYEEIKTKRFLFLSVPKKYSDH